MEKYTYNITGWLIHDAGLRTMSMQCIYKCEIMIEHYNKDEMLTIMNIIANNLRSNYTVDENHHITLELHHNDKSELSLCISDFHGSVRTDLTDWNEIKNEK